MNWLRRHFWALAAAAATVALMALALGNVDAAEAGRIFLQVRLGWVPAMAAVILGDLFIRAVRWKLLLAPTVPGAPVWPLLRLETIGLAINNVLFMRLGELARAFLAGRELGAPLMTTLASIVVERMLDLAAILLVFAGAAAANPAFVPPSYAAAGLGGAVGLLFVLAFLPSVERFLPEAADPGSWKGRLLDLLRKAAAGTRALRSPGAALACAGLSMALWLLDSGLYWAGGRAMGFDETWTYGRSILTLSSAAASGFVPAVPGSFGAFEQAVKLLLVHFGHAPTAAFSYGLFVHVFNYALVTGLGLLFLVRTGITLDELKGLRGR